MPVAEHQQQQHSPNDNDEILADRRQGWAGFVRFTTWAVGLTAIILLGLLLFVA
jgi:hypothetical protein